MAQHLRKGNVMYHAAFLMLLSLTPEQRLTNQLRSVKKVTVEYTTAQPGHPHRTIILQNPKQLLGSLTVRRIVNGAVDGADCWIRFGDGPTFTFAGIDLTNEESGQIWFLAPGFYKALNRACSLQMGEKIDVLEEAEVKPDR